MADEPVRVPISIGQFLLAVLALLLALVLGALAVVTFYLQPIFDRQEHTGEIAACNSAVNGDVWQAIAATFDTPPSPATARTEAVKKIQRAAKEFDDCR